MAVWLWTTISGCTGEVPMHARPAYRSCASTSVCREHFDIVSKVYATRFPFALERFFAELVFQFPKLRWTAGHMTQYGYAEEVV